MVHYDSPYEKFYAWLAEAESSELGDAQIAALSTVDSEGMPSTRMVKVKKIDESGFIFFTNRSSAKGRNISHHPKASLNFYWRGAHRQILIRGHVDLLTPKEMDRFFSRNSRKDKIGAWADRQRQFYRGIATFEARFDHFEDYFTGSDILRPDWWQGYRLVPETVEFLEGEEFKLHERDLYERNDKQDWGCHKVFP